MTGARRGVVVAVADSDDEDNAAAPTQVAPAAPGKQYLWPEYSPAHAARYASEISALRAKFQEEEEEHDSTMVHEYADEIFEYMNTLEVRLYLYLPVGTPVLIGSIL